MLRPEADRVRDGQERGRVTRALHLKAVHKGSVAEGPGLSPVGCPAVADDERRQHRLPVAPDMEEGRTLGCHEPLVAVARIEVRAQRIEVEWDVPRRVGAVDDCEDTPLPRDPDDALDREEQRRRRRDVRQEQHPRPVGHPARRAAVKASSESMGRGTGAVTIRAPVRRATKAQVFSSAAYSWSVVRISSPGPSGSDCATMLSPTVAFITPTRSSAPAPSSAASAARASAIQRP
jgi:hypothetical protein